MATNFLVVTTGNFLTVSSGNFLIIATATATAPTGTGAWGGGLHGPRKKKRRAFEAGQPQTIRSLSELDPPLFTPEQVIAAGAVVIPAIMVAVFGDEEDDEFMVM